MADHLIEVFRAGCILCDNAVRLVHEVAVGRATVQVHDMSTGDALAEARKYGVTRVPSVVVDGRLLQCCQGDELDEETLRRELA